VEVIVTGKITTYPGRSKYQIVIESMEIAGEGALLALLEKNRQRFAAEGLFDNARPLPFIPRRIGVVTSPTGAALKRIAASGRMALPSQPTMTAPSGCAPNEISCDTLSNRARMVGGASICVSAFTLASTNGMLML